jgi:hypothetical protein
MSPDCGNRTWRVFEVARRMIFQEVRNSRDYKYGAAWWEECLWSTDPNWRVPIVAASMLNFLGAKTGDSPLMIRARDALFERAALTLTRSGSDRLFDQVAGEPRRMPTGEARQPSFVCGSWRKAVEWSSGQARQPGDPSAMDSRVEPRETSRRPKARSPETRAQHRGIQASRGRG